MSDLGQAMLARAVTISLEGGFFMRVSRLILIAAVVLLNVVPNAIAGVVFSDGFEGSSINPFWTAAGPGTETLTSAVKHSGNQSVLFQVSTTVPWNANLIHDFGSEQFGSVSVFMERPAGSSSSAAALEISDLGVALASIQQAPDGSYIARIRPGPSEKDVTFTSTSPNDWHMLEIDTAITGLTLKFDGAAIATDPSVTAFRIVDLDNHGGPTGSAYFDDFNANTNSVVPEPSSFVLLGTILIAFATRSRIRKT